MSVSKKARKEVVILAAVIDIGHDKELDLILCDGEMEEYIWDLENALGVPWCFSAQK